MIVTGKMYAVIGRRHGRILSADLTQGSGTFTVMAVIPVIESLNFAQDIRKQTSGLACPQLMFSHWEVNIYFLVFFFNSFAFVVVIIYVVCYVYAF